MQAKQTNSLSAKQTFSHEFRLDLLVSEVGRTVSTLEARYFLGLVTIYGKRLLKLWLALSTITWLWIVRKAGNSPGARLSRMVETCCDSWTDIAEKRTCHNKWSKTSRWLLVFGSNRLRWHSKMDQLIKADSICDSFLTWSPSRLTIDSTVSASSSSNSCWIRIGYVTVI